MKRVMTLLFALLLSIGSLQAAQGDDFTLKTIDGKTLHVKGLENGLQVEEYKGKVVFLEFWGTHCPPCLISIPHYIDLQKKYKEKLAIVAIEVQGTPAERLKAFAAAKGMNYDVIPHASALDFVNYVGQRSGWRGSIPFLIILDQQGGFVTAQTGLLPEEALEGVIRELEKIQSKRSEKTKQTPAPSKKKEQTSSAPQQ
jgi:thiol-disulfide isomerase/thioredoxin